MTGGRSRDDDAAPGTGELWALYTHPGAWRQGVGSALFDAAKRELAARGFQRATLWVLTSNDRARRFYESHGWQVRSRSAWSISVTDSAGSVIGICVWRILPASSSSRVWRL